MYKIVCILLLGLSLTACKDEQTVTPRNTTVVSQTATPNAVSADPPVYNTAGVPK